MKYAHPFTSQFAMQPFKTLVAFLHLAEHKLAHWRPGVKRITRLAPVPGIHAPQAVLAVPACEGPVAAAPGGAVAVVADPRGVGVEGAFALRADDSRCGPASCRGALVAGGDTVIALEAAGRSLLADEGAL